MEPDPSEDFGVNLGAMAARGERGTLIVSFDCVSRAASNPFFPYVLERIESGIGSLRKGVADLRGRRQVPPGVDRRLRQKMLLSRGCWVVQSY